MTYCARNRDAFLLFFLEISTNVKRRPVAVRTKLLCVLTPLVHLHVLVQKATIQILKEAVRVCVNLFAFTSLCMR